MMKMKTKNDVGHKKTPLFSTTQQLQLNILHKGGDTLVQWEADSILYRNLRYVQYAATPLRMLDSLRCHCLALDRASIPHNSNFFYSNSRGYCSTSIQDVILLSRVQSKVEVVDFIIEDIIPITRFIGEPPVKCLG